MTPRDVIATQLCDELDPRTPFDGEFTMADALLTAINDAGYVIVPKEPTNKMICAALDDFDNRKSDQSYSQTYRAMIDAANS